MSTVGTVERRHLHLLSTPDLIAQYDQAIKSPGRYTAPRQHRINYICDLLLARAEAGDTEADAWLAS